MGISSCESFIDEGWYVLYDQQGHVTRLWIARDHQMIGFPLTDRPVHIEGIWTRFEDQYQLRAQTITDASEASCPFISKGHHTFYDDLPLLVWDQVQPATSSVWIGDSTFSRQIHLGLTGSRVEVVADSLPYGRVLEARLEQQDQEGMTFRSAPLYISTPAPSPDQIKVLFNRPVLASFSDGSMPHAVGSSVIESDLIQRIDAVQHTLDIAMYNTTRATLVEAVSRAAQRGVRVRYIADDETSNSALQGALPFTVRYRSGDGIMHHKFVLADEGHGDIAWLWTGSTNWSANQLSSDPNHALIIRHSSLMENYLTEFEEMWGREPGHTGSRYGDVKIQNTASLFIQDGLEIESYFSPSDETNCRLIGALQSADHHVMIGLLLLTREDLTDEIISLHERGVQVRVIVEDESSSANALARLRTANVRVATHDLSPIFHHKYAIIDEGYPDADPMVISGSHNWTWSADHINDENTLILHDQRIANIFRQEFEARWRELHPVSVHDAENGLPAIYPNPATGNLYLYNPRSQGCEVKLSDLQGVQISTTTIVAGETGSLHWSAHCPAGQYVVSIKWPDDVYTDKVVLLR